MDDDDENEDGENDIDGQITLKSDVTDDVQMQDDDGNEDVDVTTMKKMRNQMMKKNFQIMVEINILKVRMMTIMMTTKVRSKKIMTFLMMARKMRM